jgi:hypothetical protein
MAFNTLGKGFRNLCIEFSKSELHVRLLVYAIGAVAANAIGMFAVFGLDLYGRFLRRPES